jgi:hypothetical protein
MAAMIINTTTIPNNAYNTQACGGTSTAATTSHANHTNTVEGDTRDQGSQDQQNPLFAPRRPSISRGS